MDDLLKMAEKNINRLLEIYKSEKELRGSKGILYLVSDGEKVDVLYLTKDLLPEEEQDLEYFKDADNKIIFALHDKVNNEKKIINISVKDGQPTTLELEKN